MNASRSNMFVVPATLTGIEAYEHFAALEDVRPLLQREQIVQSHCHPHTEQLHTIERYTRTNFATLEKVTTIIDPGAYEKPFTIQFDASLRPGWDLMEYICNENNQDVEHIRGSPSG